MKMSFHGAAKVVSGSCFLIEAGDQKLLVDCGLFQGSKALNERNYGSFPFEPKEIDAVLLTHAHIDHSGLLPKLVRHGFDGPIYTTTPTKDLLEIMLADSAHIQESEVQRLNRRLSRQGKPLLTPIYTGEDAQKVCELVQTRPFGELLRIFDTVEVGFWPAGHMLGAASITVTYTPPDGTKDPSTTIAFSGDLGIEDQPLIVDVAKIPKADYVVMESTYGDRLRERGEDRYERLVAIIKETFARGGNVIIPAFAVGRVQNLLYGLHRMIHAGELDPQMIFVDSPLAAKATDIFCNHVESFDEEARRFADIVGDCPLYLRDLKITRTVDESIAINKIKSGAIIISSSGMAVAGRIKHHLKHNLWRKECSVVFVSYQAQGSLGRQLVDGRNTVRIHGEPVRVRAQIHHIEGFSAHADQGELLDWIGQFAPKPKHVFLVHGETNALETLKKEIENQHGLAVSVPAIGETVALESDRPDVIAAGDEAQLDSGVDELWRAVSALMSTIGSLERSTVSDDQVNEIVGIIKETTDRIQST